MPLSIMKKKSATPEQPPVAEEEQVETPVEEETPDEEQEEVAPPAAPKKTITTAKKPAVASSFLKRGKEAEAARAREQVKAEQAAKDRVFRFHLKDGEDAKITFLDGDVVDGSFDNPCAYEHFVKVAGRGKNFLCLQEKGPCPICEGNSSKYGYVTYFSVIDHRTTKSKDGTKTYKDQKRLFVAKRDTVKKLLKLAIKRGGLRGWTFDVSRNGEKSAGVGDTFDAAGQMMEKELRDKFSNRKMQYGEKTEIVDDSKPFSYDAVIEALYMSEKDLRQMGFGAGLVGGETGAQDEAGEEVEDHEKTL